MSHRLQVLVPDVLDHRISTAASRGRVSKGAWVRRALEQALEHERGAGDAVEMLAALEAPTADLDVMLAEIDRGRA